MRLLFAVITLSACTVSLAAQDADLAEQAEETTTPDAMAEPAEPRSDEFDWLRFNNGEWLKGELKDIQDGTVVFESDELGEFTLDLDDIYEIYSPGLNTVMQTDKSLSKGSLQIAGETVTVKSEGESKELKRKQIRSVIPGRPSERSYWSGSIGAGLTARSGNVDQTDLSATFRLQRRTPDTRLSFRYDGAYSEVEGERTASNHNIDSVYDVYLSDRLFVRPAGLSFYRDEFQNLEYRLSPSAGFGYDIIDDRKLTWTAGPLLGWQFERFVDVPTGDAKETDSAAVLAFTNVELEVNSSVDFGLAFNVAVPIDEFDSWNSRLTAYTDIDLVGDLDLTVQFFWDRNNSPNRNADGTLPEQDDFRLFVGLNYDF